MYVNSDDFKKKTQIIYFIKNLKPSDMIGSEGFLASNNI